MVEAHLKKMERKFHQCMLEIAVTCAVGVIVMMYAEGWSFDQAFYWACVTMTTVGYGDVVPTTPATKLFTCVFALVAFGELATAIGYMTNIPLEVQKMKDMTKVLHQFGDSLEEEELEAILNSEQLKRLRNTRQRLEKAKYPSVDRAEFILWMLVHQGKVDMEDVEPCARIFDALDPDESGTLDAGDVAHFASKDSASPKYRDQTVSPMSTAYFDMATSESPVPARRLSQTG